MICIRTSDPVIIIWYFVFLKKDIIIYIYFFLLLLNGNLNTGSQKVLSYINSSIGIEHLAKSYVLRYWGYNTGFL